jgi:hypothetical protein
MVIEFRPRNKNLNEKKYLKEIEKLLNENGSIYIAQTKEKAFSSGTNLQSQI